MCPSGWGCTCPLIVTPYPTPTAPTLGDVSDCCTGGGIYPCCWTGGVGGCWVGSAAGHISDVVAAVGGSVVVDDGNSFFID